MNSEHFIFYLSATWYGINSMIVVAHCYEVYHKRRLPYWIRQMWYLSLFVTSFVYAGLVLLEAIRSPTLFLDMSYGGVMRQLSQEAVRVTSVLHFNWGDPIAMAVLLTRAIKHHVPVGAVVLSIPFFILFAPSGLFVLVISAAFMSPHPVNLDLLNE